jgi:hypothetical protein
MDRYFGMAWETEKGSTELHLAGSEQVWMAMYSVHRN